MAKYASKNRLEQKGYFYKHSDGGSGRKAREASRRDRLQQSREVKEEEVETGIELYGKVVLLTEEVIYTGEEDEGQREENSSEAHKEGRQGIPCSDKGRCEIKETNNSKTKEEIMKKQPSKEKKHEAKETKAFEKKEDKKEKKSKGK